MRSCALALLAVLALVSSLFADGYDPSGEYWYGYTGADMTTADPGADNGQATYASDVLTLDYHDCGGNHQTRTLAVSDAQFDSEGWYNVTGSWDGGPVTTSVLAANDNMMIALNREPDGDNDVGISPLLRKANAPTSTEIVGEYAYFAHWLDVSSPGSVAERGALTFGSDGSYTGTFEDSDGGAYNESGTWSLDPADAQLDLTIGGDLYFVNLGQGNLGCSFDNLPAESDDLGFDFMMKKGTGRTASEAVGTYLVQSFRTDSGGDPWTLWGTMEMKSDGTFLFDQYEYDGDPDQDHYTITGTWTMDTDGKLTAVDEYGNTHECYLSLDGELLVRAEFDTDPGVMFMVRPVPEPGTLALLIFGAAGILWRRKTTLAAHTR